MVQPLREKEVQELMRLLSEKQKNFLDDFIKQNKKSKWLEVLAKKKGVVLYDHDNLDELVSKINDWLLVDVLDGGYGNKPYQCECGKMLRYQYIVRHQETGKTYGLGVTCFEHYTNLQPQILKDIKNGFYHIDLERDEVLLKFKCKLFFDLKPFLYVPTIPNYMKEQYDLHLPFTQRQIEMIYQLKFKYDSVHQKEIALNQLNNEQMKIYNYLTPREQKQLIEKIIHHYDYDVYIPSNFNQEEVLQFKENNLPLLDRHIRWIRNYNYNTQSKNDTLQHTSNKRKVLTSSYQSLTVKERKPNQSTMNYILLMECHLETLKKVREKEERIPGGLRKDWNRINEIVLLAKENKEFSYLEFKILLSNLIIPLKIEEDDYL